MLGRHERKTEDKIKLFRSFFSGLSDVYGTYDLKTGRARQVKKQVTNEVLLAHLTGKQSYGIYLLVKNRTRAIAVDFDTQDRTPLIEFVARAKHYDLTTYIERSKSKGYHAWIFFDKQGVIARKARIVVQHILEEIDQPQTEIFPKQDEIGTNMRYGNFINAPLFGALVPKGKTVFLAPPSFHPYPNQWDFLESAKRHTESDLDEIIELNGLLEAPQHQSPSPNPGNGNRNKFSLPPCAQKMLRNGVSDFQRVVCFRLAIHFKRLGLPHDVAVAALKTWAMKNRPVNGKGVIRESEILSQTSYAYEHSHRGFACDTEAIAPYCEASCSVKKWRDDQKCRCTQIKPHQFDKTKN